MKRTYDRLLLNHAYCLHPATNRLPAQGIIKNLVYISHEFLKGMANLLCAPHCPLAQPAYLSGWPVLRTL
ncbi:hypothetical protein [Sodalis sp.]|uniref:hypothetical protein n=1 Tax=Sodalis sp. (in: enterobacteria) TaxID=1898979 RepID=UPI0038735362